MSDNSIEARIAQVEASLEVERVETGVVETGVTSLPSQHDLAEHIAALQSQLGALAASLSIACVQSNCLEDRVSELEARFDLTATKAECDSRIA
ncbi:hypothetical protein [Phreatobacter sp.]|uniref:hypothetical protein n=1 Tax=Phreatobacter sp. TaxID=1966341 RepID=UPI003F705F39